MIGVVFFVVIGSVLLISTTITNQVAANKAAGTATAQADAKSTHLAFDATRTANALTTAEAQPTATAQANLTVTATATATASAHTSATAAAGATVFATATTTATAPPSTSRDPYPPYTGTLMLYDPLSNNSRGYNWDVYSIPTMNDCQFSAGEYEATYDIVSDIVSGTNACMAQNTNFTNFVYQAQVTRLKGDCGGISFRGNDAGGSFYDFYVCSNHYYLVTEYANHWGSSHFIQTTSPAINSNYGQTNILAVVAMGTTMTFYANGQKLTSISDASLTHGQIGCLAWGIRGDMTTVLCRNAEVWTL
jgi:hypothetical protein